MLEVSGLIWRYQDWRANYDLTVAKGALLAILGPSGAGKSTLISLIAGFLAPEGGRLLFNGQDLVASPPHLRPITTIFQDHNLFPHLDVWTNVALGVRPSLKLARDEQDKLDAALERVGLAGYAKRLPGELSGGERRRVALARALLRDQPLLLLDEPFAALDPALRYEMLDLVDELRRDRGLTVLLVSHAPDEARRIADQVAFIDGGRVMALGTPQAVLEQNESPALRAYLGKS